MRAFYIRIALTFVLASFGSNALALTLEQFWQETLAHDPRIQAYRQRLEAASENQPLALAALLPQISVQASERWNQHSIQKPYDKYLSDSVTLFRRRHNFYGKWSVQIRQALFDWSAIQNYKESGDQVAATAAQYQDSFQKLEREAIITYVNWLLAYANLKSLLDTEKGLARQAFDAKGRYEAGTTGILGAEETQVALDKIKAQLAVAQGQWLASGAMIKQFSGKNAPTAAPDLPVAIDLPYLSEARWKRQAILHNPALAAARFQLDAAQKGVGVAWGGFLPNLSLLLAHDWQSENGRLSYAYGAGPGSPTAGAGGNIPDPHRYVGSSASLELSWSIFSGGAQQAALGQAQYQEEENFSILQATELYVLQTLRSEYAQFQSSLIEAKRYRNSLHLAEKAAKSADNGVSVGLISQNNALADRQTALSVRKGLNDAITSSVTHFAYLSAAAGDLTPTIIQEISKALRVCSGNCS